MSESRSSREGQGKPGWINLCYLPQTGSASCDGECRPHTASGIEPNRETWTPTLAGGETLRFDPCRNVQLGPQARDTTSPWPIEPHTLHNTRALTWTGTTTFNERDTREKRNRCRTSCHANSLGFSHTARQITATKSLFRCIGAQSGGKSLHKPAKGESLTHSGSKENLFSASFRPLRNDNNKGSK